MKTGVFYQFKTDGSSNLTDKQEFISEVTVLGRALTKTFNHMPLMGANPIGFK